MLKLALIGGSGVWSDQAYCPALLELLDAGVALELALICDPIPPAAQKERPNLHKLLALFNPHYIYVDDLEERLQRLTEFHREHRLTAVIICCDAIHHFPYCEWAARQGIKVICDKPVVLEKESSSSLEAACQIIQKYRKLETLFQPDQFFVPLGYRNSPAFIDMHHCVRDVYQATGEGISSISMLNNFGMQRFAQEFRQGGNHGYVNGVGSLSHTFYHHLDVLLWLLQTAPGEGAHLKISLPYVYRIKDYLKQKKYRQTAHYLQIEHLLKEEGSHAESILNCEFDFAVHFTLLDRDFSPCGFMQIVNCYSGLSMRELHYHEEIVCPQTYIESGRMKQFLLDLHQGSIQHLRYTRDTKFGAPYASHLARRTHPLLGLPERLEQNYTEANDKYIDLIKKILLHWSGEPVQTEQFSGFFNQSLTFSVFAKIYEMAAGGAENQIVSLHDPSPH